MGEHSQQIVKEWGYFSIQTEALEIPKLIRYVSAPENGAINTFIGTVREWTNGRRTLYLEYQAYVPMALKKLAEIGEEIRERWPDARVAISHRIGSLQVGEAAVAIAVGTPHRDDSYRASRYAIERIKAIVPIWKKEIREDGAHWVGDQLETTWDPEGGPSLEK